MIRGAASWQAFKAGKFLSDGGQVSLVKKTPNGVSGKVRDGKRPISVSVKVNSAVDIEARCSCPQNQSTGEFCAHAVAACLAALIDPPAPSKSPSSRNESKGMESPMAYEVQLMGDWRQSFKRGKLTAKIEAKPLAAGEAPQASLLKWLGSHSITSGKPQVLSLGLPESVEFLDAVSGSDLKSAADDFELSVQSGDRLGVVDHLIQDGRIELKAEGGDDEICEVGGRYWKIGRTEIAGIGSGPVPESVQDDFRELISNGTVAVEVDDLLSALAQWQQWLSFSPDGWLESLKFVPATPQVILQLDGVEDELRATFLVKYEGCREVAVGGDDEPDLPLLKGQVCWVRNDAMERDLMTRIARHGFEHVDSVARRWSLKGRDKVLDFMASSVSRLEKDWLIEKSARLDRVLDKLEVVRPSIDFIESKDGRVQFDLRFATGSGVAVELADIQSMLRSGGGRKVAGKHMVLASEAVEDVTSLMADLELEQRDGSYLGTAAAGEVMREMQAKMAGGVMPIPKPAELPSTFRADLRPYQMDGYGWLVDRMDKHGGALLADDMGLGKTVQTIALVEQWLSKKKSGVVLVVVTTSLLGNWKSEFDRFAPKRRVHVLHGPDRDRLRDEITDGDVVITSYGTLARDLAWHLKQEYRGVVVDEASVIRNPDTDHSKALFKLKASARLALTGTPLENGVRDLWSIFRFIQPGWLGRKAEFMDRYGVKSGEVPDAQEMRRLRLKMSPFVLRRTKEQVAPELPTKLVIDEYCDLGRDQLACYQRIREEGLKQVQSSGGDKSGAARMQVLTTLLRLRQACCDLALLDVEKFAKLRLENRSAKMDHLVGLLEQAVSGGHRVLVFSQFQKQLLQIEKVVADRGWSSLRLDGQTRNRQQLVDEFQSADGPPIFLISLKAGGYGLNLTAADTVIHFDPWWNPAAEAQATDRAHRIGQTRPVTVYRLLTRNTVEDQVVRMQKAKRDLAAMIDESGGGDAAGWSEGELRSLLVDA